MSRLTPSALLLALCPTLALAQPAGVSPPEDIFVEARLADGGIALSTERISLTQGSYYRLNFACLEDGGEPELSFDLERFLRNVHLRVLTVDTIEVYLQGLSFRALQCEGPGAVRFSFYPMRAGEYEVTVTDEDDESIATTLTIAVE